MPVQRLTRFPLRPAFAECDAGKSLGATMLAEVRTRYRRLRPSEDPQGEVQTYNIVVMEVSG